MSQPETAQARRAYERQMWLRALLPFALALLLVAAGMAAVLMLPSAAQVALVADVMLMALGLCPAALIVLALLIITLALTLRMRRWQAQARSPLRRLEAATANAHQRVDGWLSGVDSRVLDWAARLAPISAMLTMFDAPEEDDEDEAES